MMSAASRSRSPARRAWDRARERATRRWPSWRCWVISARRPAACGSERAASARMRWIGALRPIRSRSIAAKPASWFSGSGSERRARTCGRSSMATAWSSPAIEKSRRALRIPSFDENSRYTVACGVSDSSLIASMVVPPYPRSRKRVRAASTTAVRVRRVLACPGARWGSEPLTSRSTRCESSTLEKRVILSILSPVACRLSLRERAMSYTVDFKNVSTVGLESSPVAEALAGLRANEARYFKNKYDVDFTVEPAAKAKATVKWVHDILKDERDLVIGSKPLEATGFEAAGIKFAYVFYESGLSINVMYELAEGGKRAVGFKLSDGMDVPDELADKFKFARQKSKLAGTIRGSYFVIKGEH